ncbi:general amino acid permease 1 [Schizopora paradoxa]|uniref:General amino acid permease 1 n=1 Tax=Schizopora paradoxa TaxID=27342 RepID=A0A0H2RQT7_9AGAM|nr:general amino acid permease 1 [Schizopora paradoxa]
MSESIYIDKEFNGNGYSTASLEKGVTSVTVVDEVPDSRYNFDAADLDQVQRRLKQRHVQMIAIAGTLGTGLFLGSGKALSTAGPLGALLAYALVGSVAYASLCSVGEMTAHAPISGTYPHFAARWVDPAYGFAMGWNLFYTSAVSIPVEITAAQIVITFWDAKPGHAAIYTGVLVLCVCAINIFGVRWFGEAEFVFAIIKLSLITGLIIVGLVIDLGGAPNHERLGFRYWKDPGALNTRADLTGNIGLGRFLAMVSVIVQAAFSFQGMELVAVAASETESPRRNISKAVRRVFFRILVFYLLGTLVTGMLVPYNDPDLLHDTGNAAQSPYVIAITRAGIKGLPSVINAAVLTSALSAGNSFLFCSSRILYGLALRGQAPRVFSRCTKDGLPYVAILFAGSFTFLAFMNTKESSAQVFNWLVNLSTVGGFLSWLGINITFIQYYRGKKAQNIDRRETAYYSNLQPYLAMWGVFWCLLFILVNGYAVFFAFNISDFLVAYVNIPIFVSVFLFWKIFKRTKAWKPLEMDFVTGIPSMEETEVPEVPPTTIFGKIAAIVF